MPRPSRQIRGNRRATRSHVNYRDDPPLAGTSDSPFSIPLPHPGVAVPLDCRDRRKYSVSLRPRLADERIAFPARSGDKAWIVMRDLDVSRAEAGGYGP